MSPGAFDIPQKPLTTLDPSRTTVLGNTNGVYFVQRNIHYKLQHDKSGNKHDGPVGVPD